MMTRLSVVLLATAFAIACSQKDGAQPAGTSQGSTTPAGAAAAPPAGAAATPPAGAAAAPPAAAATTPPATPPASGGAQSSPATNRSNLSASAPAATPAVPSAPVEPPKPRFREVTIPAGTTLSLKLATALASDTSKVEDAVRATLATSIVVGGATVIPSGSEVVGSVLEANQSGRVKGRASLAFRFDRLRVRSETHDIRTARIAREAAATKEEDAKKIGVGAGAGALLGAIAGGKKGAAIGGGIGAGAGTGVVLSTRGEEVRLAAGASLSTTLQEPITVRVPVDQAIKRRSN